MKKYKFIRFASLLICTAALPAQSGIVTVPSIYAKDTGRGFSNYIFTKRYPVHSQWIYDMKAFAPGTSGAFKSLALRRSGALSNLCPQATADVDITLAVGTKTGRTASTDFSKNRGQLSVHVFPTAKVNLPKAVYKAGVVPGWSVVIPFKKPFPFSTRMPKASSLVVDIRISNYTGKRTWYVDMARGRFGKIETVLGRFPGNRCRFSNRSASGAFGLFYSPVIPGRAFSFKQMGVPANIKGLVLLSPAGPGSKFGNATLPFSLSFLGAGTCMLGVRPDVSVPTKGGGTWPFIKIPKDQALIGGSVYTQALYFDAKANAAGLVTSPVIKWTVQEGSPVPGTSIFEIKGKVWKRHYIPIIGLGR